MVRSPSRPYPDSEKRWSETGLWRNLSSPETGKSCQCARHVGRESRWLGEEMDSELRLVLGEEDADTQRLDELSRLLRQELLQLDGDAVADVRAVPAAEVPPGARAVDAASVEGIVVALGTAAQGISAVISIVQAWRARGGKSPSDGSRSAGRDLRSTVTFWIIRHELPRTTR